MSQDRLNNLARLSIESGIAKQIDFDTVIRSFAKKKARKALYILIKLINLLNFLSFYSFYIACSLQETVSNSDE